MMKHKTAYFFTALLTLLVTSQVKAEDLLQIYQLALKNDPVFQAAQAARDAAEESITISRGQLMPQVGVNAYYSESSGDSTTSAITISGDSTTTGYSATLTQPLYRSDLYSAHSLNKNIASQADSDYETAKQNLIIRVATQYFSVLGAQDNLEFSQAELNANSRQLEQTKQRFEVGLVAITDVHEAQASYDLSVSNKIAAENILNNQIEALRAITGQYHQDLSQLKDNMPLQSPEPNDIKHWTKLALDQNPQLQASKYRVEQAHDNVDLQRSGYKPTLDFIAARSHADIDVSGSGTTKSDNTTYTLNLSVNLFAGGSTSGRVQQAEYNLTVATENLEQSRRNTQLIARNAFLGVLSSISQVKALKQLVVSSSSRLKASEAGFDVGTRTTVDVLNARQDLFNSQRQYARARYDYLLEKLRLKDSSGTLDENDLKQINSWLQ